MEIWKDVAGYENLYMVSNLGNVKSLKRIVKRSVKGELLINEKLLKQANKDGYRQVNLSNNGIKKNCKVHRLVAIAFIENIENKPIINHIDGVRHNNKVENLEWCTQSENLKHAYKIGNKTPNDAKRYNKNRSFKIVDTKTNEKYKTITQAAKKYNIKRTTLNAMLIGQNKNKTNLKYI